MTGILATRYDAPPGRLPAPPQPQTPRYTRMVTSNARWFDTSAQALVPRDEAAAVLAELRTLMSSSSPEYRAVLAGALVASYPRAPEEPEGYLLSIIEETEEYPNPAVYQAVREARRTLKFLPTTAELVGLCENAVADLRRHMGSLEDLLREHDRRAEAARREAAWAEIAEAHPNFPRRMDDQSMPIVPTAAEVAAWQAVITRHAEDARASADRDAADQIARWIDVWGITPEEGRELLALHEAVPTKRRVMIGLEVRQHLAREKLIGQAAYEAARAIWTRAAEASDGTARGPIANSIANAQLTLRGNRP